MSKKVKMQVTCKMALKVLKVVFYSSHENTLHSWVKLITTKHKCRIEIRIYFLISVWPLNVRWPLKVTLPNTANLLLIWTIGAEKPACEITNRYFPGCGDVVRQDRRARVIPSCWDLSFILCNTSTSSIPARWWTIEKMSVSCVSPQGMLTFAGDVKPAINHSWTLN